MAIENQTMMALLFRGARVRMSPLGRERHPKYGYREGVIMGRGSPSSWRVKFDERRTIQAIHQDYLELAAPTDISKFSSREQGRTTGEPTRL